ncbi:molecular chaperone [Novimethylophilus kurashikiensis]|uniref:Molecular chaperone n=1 Tax=Novimethylophilus kurashikiensis TaxID=1825523 RepID=A0A2R5FCL3_9PROT|nr:hypothetical protein [Novimethylophilus kurashikiensis]GBG14384.1 molecular chaperone [Novimethylophilus kurashikiensis]
MGQARKRGSLAERIAQAQAIQEDESPINIKCKTCGEVLNGFTLIKHTPAGAAWAKKCECGAVTTALVQARHSTLQRTFASTLGMAQEIAGDDKKCSVTFLEKSIDSIETGIIRL